MGGRKGVGFEACLYPYYLFWLGALALIFAPVPVGAVVISEINFNPPVGSENLEFIEITNDTSTPEDISGYTFVSGVSFTFPRGTILGARHSIAVCADVDAVREHHGLGDDIALGNYAGRLDSGGERITLVNHGGVVLQSLRYRDEGKWPVGADGTGHTLVLRGAHLDSKEPEHWTISRELGGSPGLVEGEEPPLQAVVGEGEEWSYAKGTGPFSDPPTAWREPEFDDSGWLVGPSGFGYRDGDDATELDDMQGSYTSVAIRKRLQLTQKDFDSPGDLILGMD